MNPNLKQERLLKHGQKLKNQFKYVKKMETCSGLGPKNNLVGGDLDIPCWHKTRTAFPKIITLTIVQSYNLEISTSKEVFTPDE